MNPEMPPKETVKKILAEINMNEAELEEAVVHLRTWLKKQPHLPKSADDTLLKSFIIGCKSVERAKSKLDAYYTARLRYSSPFFEDRDPCQIKWYKGLKLLMLPGMTPDNCKVIVFSMAHKDCAPEFESEQIFRSLFMFYEIVIRRFYMCAGVYVLADMYNLSVELTLKGSITMSGQFAKVFQECYPIRLKGFVGFNAPSLGESFFNTFVKPFFSQKLRERMSLHSTDYKSCLEKNVPLDMLPSDYGGKSPSSQQLFDETKEWLESQRSWFLKEGSEKPIEDFRPKPDNDEMKGTFRKIQVD